MLFVICGALEIILFIAFLPVLRLTLSEVELIHLVGGFILALLVIIGS
jgi:hypothetical protein